MGTTTLDMKDTVYKPKDKEKLSKARQFFNKVFNTRLENQAEESHDIAFGKKSSKAAATAAWSRTDGDLEVKVMQAVGKESKHIKLTSLSVTYWCPMPKDLWKEMTADPSYMQDIESRCQDLTTRLIKVWAQRVLVWERYIKEHGETKESIAEGLQKFEQERAQIQKECETIATEDINQYFTQKAQLFGKYKKYKFKAGVKLAGTVAGLVVSIVALATAATPAAPATLGPALVGIITASISIGNQISDLDQEAEDVARAIVAHLSNIELSYKDSKGREKKIEYKVREFVTAFSDGVTGGLTGIFWPSIKKLIDETGRHDSKVDGLEVSLHSMHKTLNGLLESQDASHKILQDNIKLLVGKTGKKALAAVKAIDTADKALSGLETAVNVMLTEKLPKMQERVKKGREINKELAEKLEALQKALGTKNIALIGSILASLSMIAIGMSGNMATAKWEVDPTDLLGHSLEGIDLLKEYTPEIMEAIHERGE